MGITFEAIEAEGTDPCMETPMNRRLTLALIATSLSLPSACAFAQYTGPGATSAVTTVAEARDQRDDQPVVLQGTLVARIGHQCSARAPVRRSWLDSAKCMSRNEVCCKDRMRKFA